MVNYKVTYYHDTCSAWVDKDPTIKHFEFEFEMSDWIDEEMERRVNETIENSFDSVSDEERQEIEQREWCHVKIEQGNHIIKDTFI